MLLHQLIHPQINEIIGRAGHHGRILIADGATFKGRVDMEG